MSQRLHSRRPAPYQARPIGRRGSNPSRALGTILAALVLAWFVGAMGVLLWVIAP